VDWVDKHAARLMPLLSQVRADLDPYAHVSPHPRRARPSERDASVQPVVPFNHGAHPSARTQATVVWAEVVGWRVEGAWHTASWHNFEPVRRTVLDWMFCAEPKPLAVHFRSTTRPTSRSAGSAGFLGSSKVALRHRILKDQDGYGIAVLEPDRATATPRH
jgi:hypothetical protein